MEIKFQGDVVTPWGVFFSGIANRLRVVYPEVTKFEIDFVPGEFPTTASISNHEADIGLTTPPSVATMAFRGVGPFNKKMKNLRAIGNFPHDDHMVWAVPANSGINSIEDMPSNPLRIVLPSRAYPVRFMVEKILELYGTPLSYLLSKGWTILEDSQCLTIPMNVVEGRADALVHEARKIPAWRQLTNTKDMKFLPIREDILLNLDRDYGIKSSKLTKGMLRGIEQDIPCIDFSEWLMFVRDDMPFDLAYSLTKIFVEKRKELFEFYYRDLPLERMDIVCPIDPYKVWQNVGIPLHPAAEKYYKEHGYMPTEPMEHKPLVTSA
ncbi:MAG: TAXI family TRAP transporter solute-binding subunit [Nitrososphaerales archaeon]